MTEIDTIEGRPFARDVDPLALFRGTWPIPASRNADTSGLYVWNGQTLMNSVWHDLPAPELGENTNLSTFGLRRVEAGTGEQPTHIEVPCTVHGDYIGDTGNASNYRSLLRDYPESFIDVRGDWDSGFLVLPLDKPVDPDLLKTLLHLRDDYPLYDDDDHSKLEMELAWEAWDQYLKMDLRSDLVDAGLDFDLVHYDLDLNDEGKGSVRETYYRLTGEQPEYPSGESGSATSVIFPYHKQVVELLIEEIGTKTQYRMIVRRGVSQAHPWLRLPSLRLA